MRLFCFASIALNGTTAAQFRPASVKFGFCIGTLILGLIRIPALAQVPLGLEEACTPHNTVQQGNVTILGRLPGYPYVVVIPGKSEEKLYQVRQCVPDALILGSRWGNYIQAGAFQDRASAEHLVDVLETLGVRDARVAFFRSNLAKYAPKDAQTRQ